MDSETVKILLSTITNDPIYDGGDWIRTNCPLAFHTHHNGTDSTPSFGISVADDGSSVCHCFTCSDKAYPIETLLHNLWIMSGEYPKQAGRILAGSRDVDAFRAKTYRDIWERKLEDIVPEPIPLECFNDVPLVTHSNDPMAFFVIDYFEKRGISKETLAYYSMRFWKKNGSMVFPYGLSDGYTYSLRQRNLDMKIIYSLTPEILGHKELRFYTPRETGVWFGLDSINMDVPVVLVEGESDVMRLKTLGLNNSMGSGTSNITRKQFSMLTCSKIYIGYDCDLAGLKARRKIYETLYGKMTLFDLDWTIVEKEPGVPCKDAGDLPNKEALKIVLKSAKRVTENYFKVS